MYIYLNIYFKDWTDDACLECFRFMCLWKCPKRECPFNMGCIHCAGIALKNKVPLEHRLFLPKLFFPFVALTSVLYVRLQ